MRRIAFLASAACALAPLLALTGTATSYAGPHAIRPHAAAGPQVAGFQQICEKDSPNLCWRDPSDGGPGTTVLNSGVTTLLSEQWQGYFDTSRCNDGNGGAVVTNTPPCPFTGGSGLNFTYQGDSIIGFQNAGSGYCAGSSFSDLNNAGTPIVKMHSCDGINGVSELSSVLVLQVFSTHFRYISVKWSNSCSCAEFINGDATNNDPLTVGPPGTHVGWVGGGF